MNKIILSGSMLYLLTLSACGGSTASTGNANNNVTSLQGIVSLQGVVSSGGAGLTPSAYPNITVVASDQQGNTVTTKSNRQGVFSLIGVVANRNYALTFIDSKTTKPLGSLVMPNNQGGVASLALKKNENLGTVQLNPKTKKAISNNINNGTLSSAVTAVPIGVDVNQDGIISKSEVTRLQAKTLTSIKNRAALTQLDTDDFFSKPGTWWSNVYHTSNTSGLSIDNYTLAVASLERRMGGFHALVDAVKESESTYYRSYVVPKFNFSKTGYYDAILSPSLGWADYTALSFPTTMPAFSFFTGPWMWANAHYIDTKKNLIYTKSDTGNSSAKWKESSALNIILGKANVVSTTDPYGTQVSSFTLVVAQENGKPYLLLDTKGIKHPVVKLSSSVAWTPDVIQCQTQRVKNSNACKTQTSFAETYLVSGFGSMQVNVKDAKGTVLAPSVALSQLQFGDIYTDPLTGKVVANNLNPLALSAPALQAVERDKMLAYIWNARDKAGVLPKATAGVKMPFKAYFHVNYDANVQSVLPASWDAYTYLPNYLKSGQQQFFSTSLNYASGASNVQFSYEFREQSQGNISGAILSTSPPINILASASDINIPKLSTSLQVPIVSKLKPINQSSYTMQNVQVTEGWVELWLVMKDMNTQKVLYEQALDTYVIR